MNTHGIYKNKRYLYESYISDFTYTLALMDEFEGLDDKGIRYDYLIARHSYSQGVPLSSRKGYHRFYYDFVIERSSTNIYQDDFDITFTLFKQGCNVRKIERYLEKILTYESANEYSRTGEIFFFDKPFLLKAQNSNNRRGYGDIRIRGELIHKGTRYGQTTDYCISGVILRR